MADLHDSFKQSGFRHLNTLSFGSGIMVAKLQKGHETKSGISAILISSSCIFLRTMEKTFGGSKCCRVARENFSEQFSVRHLKSVFPCPISTSTERRMQVLQDRWPSGQAAMSSNRHSSSKQHWHSISSPLSRASWRRSSYTCFLSWRYPTVTGNVLYTGFKDHIIPQCYKDAMLWFHNDYLENLNSLCER